MGRVGKLGPPALMMASLGFSPAGAQENVAALENPTPAGGITDVAGIRVGHFTYPDAHTGCTVVIADGGATGGVDVRGGAPGTAETDLLDPVNTVQEVNAVVLSGGSAFGLATRDGVMRYLEERGEGYRVGADLVVPIVPAAIIFDLGLSGGVRPGPDCGYAAATGASTQGVAEGNVGAGAGATVGKMRGMAMAMKGGLGTASITLESGLAVGAIVVVNAVGDVIDPGTGRIVAGARTEDGGFADARLILRGVVPRSRPRENTTIGVVATNARLSQAEVTKVAQMAQDGLARAIVPAHTPGDGDTVFSLATGTLEAGFNLGQVGALAAEAMADAIVRAVRAARGLPSLPAVRDLPGDTRQGDTRPNHQGR
ncbi:MAG: P1 family peptidase [Gemmatimonadetes bacterium]|nr:P1 family peptidase [Gemmatimonadota bacterium]MCY3612013.1 P1 family peptidase [Gemmatimonadota bacterium]MCY3677401.1 P1 family peptidase [Gemmatimonadota bacterium]